MKLLLTSAGLTTPKITAALQELVGKKIKNTNIVFIPTAANPEIGDKRWLINDLVSLENLKFKQIDIADISIQPRAIWKKKLENADVLFFGGGSSSYLIDCIRKNNAMDIVRSLSQSKVWVGVSAGSMVTSPKIPIRILKEIYQENKDKVDDISGLNLVDFYFLPHFNSTFYRNSSKETFTDLLKNIKAKVYVMDDLSALKVENANVEIITDGEYLELN